MKNNNDNREISETFRIQVANYDITELRHGLAQILK